MNPLLFIALAAAGIGVALAAGGGSGGVTEITTSKQVRDMDQREPGPGVILLYGPESQVLRDALEDCKGVRRAALQVSRMIEWYKSGEFPPLPIDEEPDDIAKHAPVGVAANKTQIAVFAAPDVIAKGKQALADQGWGTEPENLGLYLFEWTGDPAADAANMCEFASAETVSDGPGASAPPVGKGMALYLMLAAQADELEVPQEPPPPQGPTPPGPGVPGLNKSESDAEQAGFQNIPAEEIFTITAKKIFTIKGEKVMPKLDAVPAKVVVVLGELICEGGDGVTKVSPAMIKLDVDVHGEWHLFQFCLAQVTAANTEGLPPGYYFTAWRMNDTKKLVFGPFPDLRELPNGRPEIDMETAIETILGDTYAKAKALAIN